MPKPIKNSVKITIFSQKNSMEKRSGVYGIMNLCNGNMYIGSSVDILLRLKKHINALNKNKHINPRLQRAFVKYGGDNFKIDVIEFCNIDEIRKREQVWIDVMKPEYNIALTTDCPMFGRHRTEEDKKRISEKLKGRKISKETGEKISKALIGNTNRVGLKHSEETKQKMSVASSEKNNHNYGKPAWNRGKPTPEDVRHKLSVSHRGQIAWSKGKKLSDAHKNNLRKSHIGIVQSEESRQKCSASMKEVWNKRRAEARAGQSGFFEEE